ncbi:MAG: shikimate kinase [Actinomycetota bacterium]|jgi:shikimate kinase|nr:shikimate kinase [Actinomycetota bacterium]
MSVLAPGRNIVLLGLMGAGKTVVGQLVAQRLARPFTDTDAMVEARARMPVAEIFASEGERGFRRREGEAVRQASALRGQVIAVGGGAVLDPANVTHLRSTSDLVWLVASVEVLAQRVGDDPARPLLSGSGDVTERLAQLRAEREAAYHAASSAVIDTDGKTPEDIAEAVLAWVRTRPGVLTKQELRA